MGIRVPFAVSRLCRERRATLGWVGNVVVAATGPHPQITLGILARTIARATLAIAVSGRGEIPHWR